MHAAVAELNMSMKNGSIILLKIALPVSRLSNKYHHHHHQFHVADEGRRVVAPPVMSLIDPRDKILL